MTATTAPVKSLDSLRAGAVELRVTSKRKRTAALTQANELSRATVRFGYRIGALGFLISEGVLSELLPNPATYPIPNVPAALRGFVNRQGALVPVWDLHVMLETPPAPTS